MMRAILRGRGTTTTNGVEHPVVVRADEDGVHDIYYVSKFEVDYDAAAGTVNVRGVGDARDEAHIEKRLRATLEAAGVPDALRDEVLAKFEPTYGTSAPTVNYQVPFRDGESLRRPIAKIAYELAYRWFGAEELRRFILDGVETEGVQLADQAALAKFALLGSPSSEHVALLTPHADGLQLSIKLFDVVLGIVRVTTHADRIWLMPYRPAIRFDTTTRTYRDLNLIEFGAPYDRNCAAVLERIAAEQRRSPGSPIL